MFLQEVKIERDEACELLQMISSGLFTSCTSVICCVYWLVIVVVRSVLRKW